MPSPQAMIAALDYALARAGTTAVLRRRVDTGATFVSIEGVPVAHRAGNADPLAGNAAQQPGALVMSPTPINAASSWPGDAGGGTWPKKGDMIVIGGAPKTVETADPIEVLGTVVRINLTVKG